jgi:hypothetical protein
MDRSRSSAGICALDDEMSHTVRDRVGFVGAGSSNNEQRRRVLDAVLDSDAAPD